MKIILYLSVLFYYYGFSNEKIDVNFKDLDISGLIQISSKILNKNIYLEDEINGKINFISNEPLEKEMLLNILTISLNSKGFNLTEKNDTIYILKQNETNIENHVLSRDVVFLKNADAKSLVDILNKLLKEEDRSSVKLAFDEDLNCIIIKAPIKELQDLKDLVNKLDKVNRQVYVKAKIIEVSEQKTKMLGLKYGLSAGKNNLNSGIFTLSTNFGGEALAFEPSSIGLSSSTFNEGLALGVAVNFLNQNGAADIVSEPSLLCINNKESSIYVGETRSIKVASTITDSGKTNDTFERKDIGLTLKIKPRISSDEKVLLDISTVLENVSQTVTNGQPNTTKKDLLTTAIVNNGESVILGGYIKEKNFTQIDKIPFLGDIPILGYAFRDKNNIKDKINLVIVITPYVIPKDKDLTFIRQELSKLDKLENEYTKKLVLKLEDKK